ncbi:hypothetical protein B0H13DRAFT_2393727 [Mycena leptocephala]|nr:hypothetical protein B0H13DRAFT_2393727 [Mycena leptocephala]
MHPRLPPSETFRHDTLPLSHSIHPRVLPASFLHASPPHACLNGQRTSFANAAALALAPIPSLATPACQAHPRATSTMPCKYPRIGTPGLHPSISTCPLPITLTFRYIHVAPCPAQNSQSILPHMYMSTHDSALNNTVNPTSIAADSAPTASFSRTFVF